MSDDPAASSDNTTIVEQYGSFLAADYASLAASALVFFDYLITMDGEIDLFWKRKFSGATALFMANRYLIIVFSGLCLALIGIKDTTWTNRRDELRARCRCNDIVWTTVIAQIVAVVAPAVFSARRALALSNSRIFSSLVLLISLGPVGADIAQLGLGLSGFVDPLFGCLVEHTVPSYLVEIGLTVASRGSLIVADSLIVALTWWKLFRSLPPGKMILVHGHLTLTEIFLRDGTIYFLLLLVLNVVHLIFSLTSVFDDTPGDPQSNITTFTTPLTAILVSRFLTNLQEANLRNVRIDSDDPLYISSHPDNSMPSFVAAPGAARITADPVGGDADNEVRLVGREEIDGGAEAFSGGSGCVDEEAARVDGVGIFQAM